MHVGAAALAHAAATMEELTGGKYGQAAICTQALISGCRIND